MKRALRTVSRALVAAMALSLVLTICPCPPGAEGAMDDCCEGLELSISNPCCDEAPSVSQAPVSPAIVSLAAPLAVRVAPVEFPIAVAPAERVFSRSAATRTVLRI